jgi:hypothetical protein
MDSQSSLLPADAPRWAVIVCHAKQTKAERAAKQKPVISHYELVFGNHVESKRKGESGYESLMEIAKFLNKRKMIPRPKIQCAADAQNPESYIQSIS